MPQMPGSTRRNELYSLTHITLLQSSSSANLFCILDVAFALKTGQVYLFHLATITQ